MRQRPCLELGVNLLDHRMGTVCLIGRDGVQHARGDGGEEPVMPIGITGLST